MIRAFTTPIRLPSPFEPAIPPAKSSPQSTLYGVLAGEAKSIVSTDSDVFSAMILNKEQCKELKMGSYLGAAAAASANPHYIHRCYKPPGGSVQIPCIVQSIFNLCSQGNLTKAIESLDTLREKGLRVNTRTFSFLLQQCAHAKSLKETKWVHIHMKISGLKPFNTLLSNQLIHAYCECGSIDEARNLFDKMHTRNLYSWNNMLSGYSKLGMMNPARRLFDNMPEKDVVSWNTLVTGYAQTGCFKEALRVYKEFTRMSIGFNEFSFAGVLTACVKAMELGLTRQVHCHVFVAGFSSNVVLGSLIVDAYAKCRELGEARLFFDEMPWKDVPAWTTLISGYSLWGEMKLARELFDDMPRRNSVSWTVLISGYGKNGLGYEALELFARMIRHQFEPDQFTFSSCLCTCASIASLKHGKQIHARLVRTNFRPNAMVVGSLIDMYSKCGSLGAGQQVFESMGNKQDPVIWNSLISALAQHGYGERAIKLFAEMVKSGVEPDRITFVVLLNACCHSGLVDEGLQFFESMIQDYSISPDQEHYACLIDVLGRTECFDELKNQLKRMPLKPDSRVWNALLGVCRNHSNIELGRKAAEQLIELDPQSSAAYVFLSSTYAVLGRWESVADVRKLMVERNVKKERAISWLEIESKLHVFTVSDRSHPLIDEIYSVLKIVADHMEDDDS